MTRDTLANRVLIKCSLPAAGSTVAGWVQLRALQSWQGMAAVILGVAVATVAVTLIVVLLVSAVVSW